VTAAAKAEAARAESLALLMRALKLPAFSRYAEEIGERAETEGWTFRRYLHHLAELEIEERRRRRIERNLKDSELPGEKTLATINRARLPAKIQKTLPALCEGSFVERGENLLAFGLPGRGKTHLACAIGHELIQRGYRVFFTPTFALVQRLLVAKRDLVLERELARLDRFDAVILDDIGYVQQSREEMELHLPLGAVRAAQRRHHQQQPMGKCSCRQRGGVVDVVQRSLDVPVVRRLAGPDEVEVDAALVGPGVDDGARELAAVVDADRVGLAVQVHERCPSSRG
jgi:DNA replication protein DnaC